ncbi:hypothetical protein LINPERHAP1_LOCUS3044, partial [Linum perenne]
KWLPACYKLLKCIEDFSNLSENTLGIKDTRVTLGVVCLKEFEKGIRARFHTRKEFKTFPV